MTDASLEALLAQGAVEQVTEDLDAARRDLVVARAHLESAAALSESDPSGAFGLAYDAMRKSIVAHMRANGLRVKTRTGAHYQTGRYGVAALSGQGVDAKLREFDTLRALRNRSEYRGALVKEADVAEAILLARAVLDVVAKELE